jgi:hypothetical protein
MMIVKRFNSTFFPSPRWNPELTTYSEEDSSLILLIIVVDALKVV